MSTSLFVDETTLPQCFVPLIKRGSFKHVSLSLSLSRTLSRSPANKSSFLCKNVFFCLFALFKNKLLRRWWRSHVSCDGNNPSAKIPTQIYSAQREFLRCHHSSMDSSATPTLLPRVRVPSIPSMIFFNKKESILNEASEIYVKMN